MFTCLVKYELDLTKLEHFREYAYTWIVLIEKYGGTHHGYFLPGEAGDLMPDPTFSFPGLGSQGPANLAVALFSFPDVDSYENYRRLVADDPLCKEITEKFNATKSFIRYERNFLKPIFG
jgi:hypothetical protein